MNKKYITIALIALLLAVSESPAVAQGADTHHVSEGESIQAAIDNAAPGDTIVIGPGEYFDGELSIHKPLTLKGSGADNTILYGSIILSQLWGADGQVPQQQYNTISGMTIDNFHGACDAYGFHPAITTMSFCQGSETDLGGYYLSNVSVSDCIIWSFAGIYLTGVENVEVRNTELYGFPVHLVFADGEPDGDLLANSGLCILMCGTVSISSNCLMGFYEPGITTDICSAVRIVNNIVLGGDSYGISAVGDSVIVTNNTLVSNRLAIGVRSVTATVANNIAYLPTLFPEVWDGSCHDIEVQATEDLNFVNNDIYRDIYYFNTPLYGISEWGFPPGYFIGLYSDADLETVSGNIFEDPFLQGWPDTGSSAGVPGLDGAMIVHGSNVFNIFKIRQSSPCIDAGVNAGAGMYGNVRDDFYGTIRPQGKRYDIGAHEYAIKSFSPAIIQPLARMQLQSVLSLWENLMERLPEGPTDDMAALIAQIQGHVANAAQLTNPIYASGQLSKAAEAMQQLAALLV